MAAPPSYCGDMRLSDYDQVRMPPYFFLKFAYEWSYRDAQSRVAAHQIHTRTNVIQRYDVGENLSGGNLVGANHFQRERIVTRSRRECAIKSNLPIMQVIHVQFHHRDRKS